MSWKALIFLLLTLTIEAKFWSEDKKEVSAVYLKDGGSVLFEIEGKTYAWDLNRKSPTYDSIFVWQSKEFKERIDIKIAVKVYGGIKSANGFLVDGESVPVFGSIIEQFYARICALIEADRILHPDKINSENKKTGM